MSANLKQEVSEMIASITEDLTEILYRRFYEVAAERDTYFNHLVIIAEEYERDGVLSEATKIVLDYILLLNKSKEEKLQNSEEMKESYK